MISFWVHKGSELSYTPGRVHLLSTYINITVFLFNSFLLYCILYNINIFTPVFFLIPLASTPLSTFIVNPSASESLV